jgi:hypothetical protein
MEHRQVAKQSGSSYHFNLDSISMTCLAGCQDVLTRHSEYVFSNSVIVRRALRQYQERIGGAGSRELDLETVEAKRAARGIL